MMDRYRNVLFRSKRLMKSSKLMFSTSTQENFKVTVLGACGGIGQPLCLLLKKNLLVSQLALYDVSKGTPGVAVDLSHINTHCICKSYVGIDQIKSALNGTQIVIILGGAPQNFSGPINREIMFSANSTIVLDFACAISRYSPHAVIAIITNPVNSMVPLTSEVMTRAGVYDANKIFGVSTLDLVRASTIVAEFNKTDPTYQYVPVVGGHSEDTIVPLLSQSDPPVALDGDTAEILTTKIIMAGIEVIVAKARIVAATLSMAFAGARFIDAVLRGLNGESNIKEHAYVKSNITEAPYFASCLLLGKQGIEKNLGYGKVSNHEKTLIKKAIPMLQKDIKNGIEFVEKQAEKINK